MSTSKILRSAALLGAVVVLGAAALSAGGADAAKGGKHGAHQTGGGATLVITPNPVAAYSSFHVDGCGYTGTTVQMNLVQPAGVAAWAEPVGTDGCTHFDWSANGAGAYTLNAYQGQNWTLMASAPFSVY